MDNNQPPAPAPQPVVPPPVQPVPQAPVMPPPAQQSEPKSKTPLYLGLGALFLVLILAGGVYYFMTMQNNNAPAQSTTNTVNSNQVSKTSDLESELKATEEASVGADFEEVDADLQAL